MFEFVFEIYEGEELLLEWGGLGLGLGGGGVGGWGVGGGVGLVGLVYGEDYGLEVLGDVLLEG